MNKIKKILLLSMAVTALMLCFVFSSSAANSGYYAYKVVNGKAKIMDVNTSISGDVTVPSKLGGYIVDEICDFAFSECDKIEYISLPDSLKTIGKYAFEYCYGLQYIDIPDNVTSVGDFAFAYCSGLDNANIGDGVKKISKGMFGYCVDLDYVIIPFSVKIIDELAFHRCNDLVKIYYEGSVAEWNEIIIYDYNDNLYETELGFSILDFPTNFKGSSTCTTVSFHWDPVVGAEGYKVYIKSGSKWKVIKNVTDPKITVKGLEAGTKYTFAVKPFGRYPDGKILYKDGYTSTYSATKPVNIAKVSTNQTTDAITLTWSKVKCSGYRIYLKTSSGWKTLKTTTANSYKVTGLTNGKKYVFAVRPYSKFEGFTAWAEKYTSVTTVKLATPTLKLASTAKGRATIAWTNVAGETGYQVYYSTSKSSGYKRIANYKANSTKAYKTGLTSGKTYYFKVRAYTKTDSGYVYSDFSTAKYIKIK